MLIYKQLLGIIICVLTVLSVNAEQDLMSPVGRWVTIDDDTGEPKSIVEITLTQGNLEGKVAEILTEPDGPEGHICKECEDERHNQPILGMLIMWGYEQDGESWRGGEILDPNNGEIYSSKLVVDEQGKHLRVRGYIGFSLLGRTQVWIREQFADIETLKQQSAND